MIEDYSVLTRMRTSNFYEAKCNRSFRDIVPCKDRVGSGASSTALHVFSCRVIQSSLLFTLRYKRFWPLNREDRFQTLFSHDPLKISAITRWLYIPSLVSSILHKFFLFFRKKLVNISHFFFLPFFKTINIIIIFHLWKLLDLFAIYSIPIQNIKFNSLATCSF